MSSVFLIIRLDLSQGFVEVRFAVGTFSFPLLVVPIIPLHTLFLALGRAVAISATAPADEISTAYLAPLVSEGYIHTQLVSC